MAPVASASSCDGQRPKLVPRHPPRPRQQCRKRRRSALSEPPAAPDARRARDNARARTRCHPNGSHSAARRFATGYQAPRERRRPRHIAAPHRQEPSATYNDSDDVTAASTSATSAPAAAPRDRRDRAAASRSAAAATARASRLQTEETTARGRRLGLRQPPALLARNSVGPSRDTSRRRPASDECGAHGGDATTAPHGGGPAACYAWTAAAHVERRTRSKSPEQRLAAIRHSNKRRRQGSSNELRRRFLGSLMMPSPAVALPPPWMDVRRHVETRRRSARPSWICSSRPRFIAEPGAASKRRAVAAMQRRRYILSSEQTPNCTCHRTTIDGFGVHASRRAAPHASRRCRLCVARRPAFLRFRFADKGVVYALTESRRGHEGGGEIVQIKDRLGRRLEPLCHRGGAFAGRTWSTSRFLHPSTEPPSTCSSSMILGLVARRAAGGAHEVGQLS